MKAAAHLAVVASHRGAGRMKAAARISRLSRHTEARVA
jgi:hypothetical protein